MFKINIKLKRKHFRQIIKFFILFFFFTNTGLNHSIANSKIYLDLKKIIFDHDKNYKSHETSSQLIIQMDLDKEIEKWAKKKFILKGNSGELKIKIIEEKIFDNFVKEHAEKFSFIPKEGISYKVFFKVIVLAENTNNNAFAQIISKVNGDRTFLGRFSINERSKAMEETIKLMVIKLENNIEEEINKKFKDFLTNKYN